MAPNARAHSRSRTDGTLTGLVDTTHSGPEGADYAPSSNIPMKKSAASHLKGRSLRTCPASCSNSFKFVQPPALDKPLEVHYKLTAAQYAHQAGPLLLVRPRVVGSHALPFDDKPRTVPIDLNATGHWRDSFDITLPAGYVVDETPDPVAVDVDFASYHSTVTAKDNQLHYERDYVVRQVRDSRRQGRRFPQAPRHHPRRRKRNRSPQEAIESANFISSTQRSAAPFTLHPFAFSDHPFQ